MNKQIMQFDQYAAPHVFTNPFEINQTEKIFFQIQILRVTFGGTLIPTVDAPVYIGERVRPIHSDLANSNFQFGNSKSVVKLLKLSNYKYRA